MVLPSVPRGSSFLRHFPTVGSECTNTLLPLVLECSIVFISRYTSNLQCSWDTVLPLVFKFSSTAFSRQLLYNWSCRREVFLRKMFIPWTSCSAMFLWNCFSIGSAVHNTLFCHWSCSVNMFWRYCSTIDPEVQRCSTIDLQRAERRRTVLSVVLQTHTLLFYHWSVSILAKFSRHCLTNGPQVQRCSSVGHSVPAKFSRHCSKLILYFSSIAYTVCTVFTILFCS